MQALSILLVGPSDEAARAECPSPIDRLADFARVEHAADLQTAGARLTDGRGDVELVVLCETRPGQFSATDIDNLRRRSPLVRFWRLLGSWCEGEQRSAQPPSGCTNTYWHQWSPRSSRQFAAARQGNRPAWGWPLTATADELALVDSASQIEPRAGRISIRADRAETASALADACRVAGYEPHVIVAGDPPPDVRTTAVVWDTSVDEAADPQRVQQVRSAAGGGPVVAIIGFPRPADQRRAIAAGVAAVISKPFLVRDLLWQLARVADGPD